MDEDDVGLDSADGGCGGLVMRHLGDSARELWGVAVRGKRHGTWLAFYGATLSSGARKKEGERGGSGLSEDGVRAGHKTEVEDTPDGWARCVSG